MDCQIVMGAFAYMYYHFVVSPAGLLDTVLQSVCRLSPQEQVRTDCVCTSIVCVAVNVQPRLELCAATCLSHTCVCVCLYLTTGGAAPKAERPGHHVRVVAPCGRQPHTHTPTRFLPHTNKCYSPPVAPQTHSRASYLPTHTPKDYDNPGDGDHPYAFTSSATFSVTRPFVDETSTWDTSV